MRAGILVTVMALVTMTLRFLPFLVFRKQTPPYITYLGQVLPSAIIGMLVIYCLRDVDLTTAPFGLSELLAAGCVVGVQAWKRNSILSILAGTVLYMALIRMMV